MPAPLLRRQAVAEAAGLGGEVRDLPREAGEALAQVVRGHGALPYSRR